MRLIANGDDFGITRACNYAIIDCYKSGILRSTSMMPNMPHVEHAAELMKENPGLSVGIHFNLTVGKPLTNCPSLCKEDGTFDKGKLKNSDDVVYEEIVNELEAQYKRFVEVTGQKPVHLNSHHGICMIKGAEKAQIEIANREGLPIRTMFTMMMGKNQYESDYEMPKGAGIFKQNGEPVTVDEFINIFTPEMLASDDVYEYAAHPGYVDYEILQFSSLTTGRCYDAEIFMSEKVKKWAQDNKVELVDYSVLKKK